MTDVSSSFMPQTARRESLMRGRGPGVALAAGVEFRALVSGASGAQGLTTGLVTIQPGAVVPYHLHRFSEAIVVLTGEVYAAVEGRTYLLTALDCIHIPSGVAHSVANLCREEEAMVHSSFASAEPSRELVEDYYANIQRGRGNAAAGDPEYVARFSDTQAYELSCRAEFRDLFGGAHGASGICGGYGRFQPEASLPCHYHHFDESITIIEGEAVCQVQGNEYTLRDCDSACVPAGRPHRFLNRSVGPMAMIWVYAGNDPERMIVDAGCCSRRGA